MAQAFRIKVAPVDGGALTSVDTIKKGVSRSDEGPHEVVLKASDVQIRGLYNYMALIKNGDDTSSVETAINALL